MGGPPHCARKTLEIGHAVPVTANFIWQLGAQSLWFISSFTRLLAQACTDHSFPYGPS